MNFKTILLKCAGIAASVLVLDGASYSLDRLTVVYTNSLNGYLDYCHCAADPKGGLVKRATEFGSIKSRYGNIVFVDTGDNLTYDPDPLGAQYLARGLKHIGYDVMTPGDQEFSNGAEKFLALAKGLSYVCGNLEVKLQGKWRSPFPGYRIMERGGIKTAVIGTIASDAFRYYPAGIKDYVRILPQSGELKKNMGDLRKLGAEFIILLSHSGFERDQEIADEIRDIDVIVGGHSQTLLKNPVKRGGTVIVQAGANGAHIGILELVVDRGKVVSFKNSFRRPDEFRPADDPHVRGLINEYKEKLKKESGSLRFE